MKKQITFPRYFLALPACVILLLSFACANEDNYIGTYTPTKNTPPELADLIVEFKKDGQGIRRFRGEAVSFEWAVKCDEIRIHTKNGGIIVAKMRNNILEIMLPGSVIHCLKKID